jgi:predicted negative regulator of RcsB-dependent stress response
VDRITRKELKTDHFVETVGHTLEGISQHRSEVKRYALIGVVVLAVILAAVGFFRYRAAERETALSEFFRVLEAPILPAGQTSGRSFETEAAKNEAVEKAVSDLVAKYPGSNEAAVATYFRATDAVERGELDKALTDLDLAVSAGNADTRALANYAKAGVLNAQGKKDEAEKALRAVVGNPGRLILKEQAELSLAEMIAESKPDEAMKLLEPLRTQEGIVQQSASKLHASILSRKERAAAK